jgi:hypothetical protein
MDEIVNVGTAGHAPDVIDAYQYLTMVSHVSLVPLMVQRCDLWFSHSISMKLTYLQSLLIVSCWN